MTTIEDGMDWIDDVADAVHAPVDAQALALDGVASAARRELYNVVRRAFNESVRSDGLTRQELARRLHASRALVSRWLTKPSNMTIESAAKLMYVMGRELKVGERETMHRGIKAANVIHAKTFDVSRNAGVLRAEAKPATVVTHGIMAINVFATDQLYMLALSGCGEGADGIYEQIEPFPAPSSPRVRIRRLEAPEIENA